MKTYIISLGGSLIIPGENIDVAFLKKFRRLILTFTKKNRVVIVTGGGRINKKYNLAARTIAKVKNIDLDWLGIAATRFNAEFIRALFGPAAYERVVTNPTRKLSTRKKIIIGCGWLPGCSSDKDAVLLAKNFKATTLINLTDIDYVYDKDPDKYRNAKPYREMSWALYRKVIGGKWIPRLSTPFDPIAAKLACRLGLGVVILNGKKLGRLEAFLKYGRCQGTSIH